VGTAIQVAIYGTSSAQKHTPISQEMVYALGMGRTNIEIDETLVRKARKLTRLKTKREIVDKALELLVRSESRKGILRYYGTGIWKGDVKAMRRNRR
jgi:Arc/MetJ family transcription regulator